MNIKVALHPKPREAARAFLHSLVDEATIVSLSTKDFDYNVICNTSRRGAF